MKNGKQITKAIAVISFALFIPLIFTHETSAVSLSTNSLDLHYAPNGANSYRWQNGMLYGQTTGGTENINYVNVTTGNGYANLYQFTTPTISTTGNYASIHFETNIVIGSINSSYIGNFVNLPYMKIQVCNGSGAFSSVKIASSNISTAITEWNNGANKTLTIYGDIVFKDIQANSSGNFICQIGNPSYAFISTANVFSSTYVNRIYFEQNPGYIEYSNNINDALLQTQIWQNDVMINNQTIIADGIGQTTDAVNNLNQSITDSTVNGNFDIAGIQPFGPIGTITTSILELPRIIMNVNPCETIKPTLPYVNEELEIPCPSVVLTQMGGNFINMLDTLCSAGLYFFLGRYIFKKVQNLRDPTNEDEEYLDI